MKFRIALLSAAFAGLSSLPLASAQTTDGAQHILNLTDVDISTLIEDVASMTGYTFNIHPEVRANVTVNSQQPLSTDELFRVFLSTLRVNGYTAVPAGRRAYRIVPEEVASFDAGFGVDANDTFATQVFTLTNFSAVEAAKMIKPLLGPRGQVTASPLSNSIIVVEYGSNIAKIRSLLNRIDEDRSVTKTISLKRVPVAEMQSILNDIDGQGEGRSRSDFLAIGSQSSNSIVLRGNAEAVERASRLIEELDSGSALQKDTRVVRLSHAQADEIEPILRQLADDQNVVGGAQGAGSSTATSIAVHAPSNALIMSAAPDMLTSLMNVVAELDQRRTQVLVEAIVVDVSDTAARELGLQFLVAGEDGDVPFVSSRFSRATPNLLGLSGALAGGAGADDSSIDLLEQAALASLLGASGGTLGFSGTSNGNLFSVVLNALQDDTESNVLSTPSILTLDNQTALVSVGQEIPIVSGQVLGDANANPFQTTERREIGVILNVTPHVGQDGTIRLDIDQEVSSIAGTVGSITPDFILNQSQLQTSVIADDGELIVLGGLIQAEDVIELSQVPLLGDIPGLGRLFRSEGKSRATSNLMVFIRPTVLKSREDAAEVTARTYNYIRAQQIIANEGDPGSLDQFVGQVLNGEPVIEDGEAPEPAEEESQEAS